MTSSEHAERLLTLWCHHSADEPFMRSSCKACIAEEIRAAIDAELAELSWLLAKKAAAEFIDHGPGIIIAREYIEARRATLKKLDP